LEHISNDRDNRVNIKTQRRLSNSYIREQILYIDKFM
jgi:hypothetical protein